MIGRADLIPLDRRYGDEVWRLVGRLVLAPAGDLLHRVPAGTGLPDQFGLAHIAAYAFLEVDLFAANSPGGTGLLTHLAHGALRHPADAQRTQVRYDPKSCTKGADIATVEALDQHTGHQDCHQDNPQQHRRTQEKYGTER